VRRRLVGMVICVLGALALPAGAHAAFPWPGAGTAGNPASYHVDPGQDPVKGTATEINCGDWKGAATPEPASSLCSAVGGNPLGDAQDALVRADPHEIGGIRGDATTDVYATDPVTGAPVHTAWNVTTGRPDVSIAVLDSGIEWDNREAMMDLRHKIRLNRGELPIPNHRRTVALDTGPDGKPIDCGAYKPAMDANGDGVFNIDDYACDTRVEANGSLRAAPPKGAGHPRQAHGAGPDDLLDPEDVIIAFSDGTDRDHNGFVDDIAGWDFVDDDNDAYDDVGYGHGTGEARDSNAEADNGGDVGTCPNCMVVPLRVGESFVADVNRFGRATLYATDLGVSVVQEALGTLDNSTLARQAIDYAYSHGVTVVASAADEAAQHHNLPGVLPHTILVNSVTRYDSLFTPQPRSYLQLNGCTNFMSRLTVAVPSASCSSEATGRAAGIVGLIYSAALDARARGAVASPGGCNRIGGAPCPIDPDEVRQLFQGTADDVNFATLETSCQTTRAPLVCTDPNTNAPSTRVDVSPLANTRPYPARGGFDEFYGYGRLNADRAVRAAAAGAVGPAVSIESPDWFKSVDPASKRIDVRGLVAARRSSAGYTCRVLVAPGVDPANGADVSAGHYADTAAPGDFRGVAGGFCDGSTVHRGASAARQLLGSIDTAALRAQFPAVTQRTGFTGAEPGGTAQTSNGRPSSEPYAFTVKVVATTVGTDPRRSEDRRQMTLHRDADLLPGFPRRMTSDGDSSPLLVDLDGDNRNELVFATSDGTVHALRRNGSELRGFPVHGDTAPTHTGERAFRSGQVRKPPGSAILASLAAGDLNGDGIPELVGADLDGRVYVWSAKGRRLRTLHANPHYSGRPLRPFVNVRHGGFDRVETGFIGSPVLADINGDKHLDIVAASEDRHLYAWNGRSGRPLPGFPVLVADMSKVAAVDPVTNHLTFRKGVSELNQGKLVDTPAVGDIDGDGKPEIVIGSNEEYLASEDGGVNSAALNSAAVSGVAISGLLKQGNGRVYAFHHDGKPVAGWPKKVGLLDAELLPDVGEGVNGSPVLAPLQCSHGGGGTKIGVMPAAGVGYVFNADGSSCYGSVGGKDVALQSDVSEGSGEIDRPIFPAVGLPAFGDLHGTGRPSFVAPATGILRAIDLIAPEYQAGSQDFTGAWNAVSGQFEPGFPARQNDLSFLSGPAIADIDGRRGEEILAGTSSMDLQAFDATGAPVTKAWPKLTAGWTVATPDIGSLGTLDTNPNARKVVVSLTREGDVFAYSTKAPACSPGSSPRFHHDNANSGSYVRDAVAPGRPTRMAAKHGSVTFKAPGDDLMCGAATRYQVLRSSRSRFTGLERGWRVVKGVVPKGAGGADRVKLPAGRGRYVAVRAVDDQGNIGRPSVARVQ
jgi:hypothetical protein